MSTSKYDFTEEEGGTLFWFANLCIYSSSGLCQNENKVVYDAI